MLKIHSCFIKLISRLIVIALMCITIPCKNIHASNMPTSKKYGCGAIGIVAANIPVYFLYKSCKQELINRNELRHDLKTFKKVFSAIMHIAHPNKLRRTQARQVVKRHKLLASCIIAEIAGVSTLTIKGVCKYKKGKKKEKEKEADTQTIDVSRLKTRGLQNLGTTCYANASYQLLAEDPEIDTYLKEEEFKPDAQTTTETTEKKRQEHNNREELKKYLRTIIDHARGKSSDGVTKAQIGVQKTLAEMGNPEFGKSGTGYSQEDAEEFIIKLLDRIGSRPTIVIGNYIQEEGSQQIKHVDKSKDDSRNHLIQIPLQGKPKPKDLGAALQDEFKDEKLTGDNRWMNVQGRKVDATKFIKLKSLPDHIIIQLQRFGFDSEKQESYKITSPIKPTAPLNIPVSTEESTKETLQAFSPEAVVIHTGTPYGGHYYTYKQHHSGKWIKYNDSLVSVPDQKEAIEDIEQNGYLFLYAKEKVTIAQEIAEVIVHSAIEAGINTVSLSTKESE